MDEMKEKITSLENNLAQTNELLKRLVQHDQAIDNQISNLTAKMADPKIVWRDELLKQLFGALVIICGFGLIAWRSVSILETRFIYLERDLDSTKTEVFRIRDQIDSLRN